MKLNLIICLLSFLIFDGCDGNILAKGAKAIRASFSKSKPKIQTTFHLYTRNNPTTDQVLTIYDHYALNNSNFNKEWPIRMLIHGFQSSGNSKMTNLIRDAYFNRGDYNIISVDWSPISRKLNYLSVTKKIPEIARIIADFTLFLHEFYDVSFNNMYLIGHSLGAQIAGFAGRFVSPHKFNTIFALDPAGPKYRGVDIDERLTMSDANYVESIQTHINGLGFKEPIGHSAFYPNYGKTQPGCNLGSCVRNLMCEYGCSHRRSYEYFAESINSVGGFWASECNSFEEILKEDCTSSDRIVLMGGEPAEPKFGIFYLQTKSNSPFANGKLLN